MKKLTARKEIKGKKMKKPIRNGDKGVSCWGGGNEKRVKERRRSKMLGKGGAETLSELGKEPSRFVQGNLPKKKKLNGGIETAPESRPVQLN